MTTARRRICVFTGTRAEYGLLYWLLREIDEDEDLSLQLIVSGMHLAREFGSTQRIIEEDGFHIDERVEMLLASDTPVGVAKSMSLATMGVAEALGRLHPDVFVLLGDRYEVLAAAQAAMLARVPIAHIHGGESTEGLIDEAIRHAVTKMAHLHFVAAEPFRRRVIQLGEHPDRVYTTGAPGLDNVRRLDLPERGLLEEALDLELGAPVFLVTYHPVTLEADGARGVDHLLEALDEFQDAAIVFTMPNADPAAGYITEALSVYVAARPGRTKFVPSLGQSRYLGLMSACDVVIGNSSSGLIEAPALKTATVNIGDRQRGRLRAASVIDCPEDAKAIRDAIGRALSTEFSQMLDQVESPYGDGRASPRIKETLKSFRPDGLLMKRFYDLEVET